MSSSEQTPENPVAESKEETTKVSTEKSKKTVDKSTNKPVNRRSPLLLIFIVLLLATGAGGFYLWQTLSVSFAKLQVAGEQYSEELYLFSTKFKNAESAIELHKQQLNQLNNLLNEQQNQFKALSDSHKTLLKTAENVFDITHRNQYQWSLAEVSYLLSLANQRLIVSRDIKSATAALKAANFRLHDLSDPSLLTLRKKITEEITQLSLVKLPDINGIAFTLDYTSSLIAQLPFKSAQQKHTESTQTSTKVEIASLDKETLFAPLWDEIKSLVTIKKHQRTIQASETALDKNEIDKQLRYRLDTARAALINNNTSVFQNEIQNAVNLLTVYYNSRDNRVEALLNDLSALSSINLVPELPDITASWSMLQKIIARKAAVDNINKNQKGKSIQ